MDTWQSFAACLGMDPDLFFPRAGATRHNVVEMYREAREACSRCPVHQACLEDALEHQDYDAFRASLTPAQLTARGRRLRATRLQLHT